MYCVYTVMDECCVCGHCNISSKSWFYTCIYRAHVICYIMCRSPGRIVETVLEDITELNGGGLLSVTVQNTGSVSAEYSVI